MRIFGKFAVLSLERKLLVLFLALCISLPFSMASLDVPPLKIFVYAAPLWIYFHGGIGLWVADGKPLWQAALACYGVSSVEILGIYFGTFGFRLLLKRTIGWLKRKLQKGVKIPFGNQFLFLKERSGYRQLNSFTENKKRIFVGWLGRQSIWIILLFLFLPLPVSDILATVVLGARGLKYGHWYLMAINLPHIFLLVYLLYLGIDFAFL